MIEYDNVKDALKKLVRLNEPGTVFGKVSTITDGGVKTGERSLQLEICKIRIMNF